jgi:hypothetical protein
MGFRYMYAACGGAGWCVSVVICLVGLFHSSLARWRYLPASLFHSYAVCAVPDHSVVSSPFRPQKRPLPSFWPRSPYCSPSSRRRSPAVHHV